ncbi:hypothetical protein [Falsiroseomonas sp.]|uniref:hypothetical protein n=1 Tax=Falsiroseomonas sp. TaxID=2870721 RepID=UPI003F716331
MDANDPDDLLQNAAAAFFTEMVEPTVAEFMAAPDNRRRGCLACLVVSSLADHYFHAIEAPKLGEVSTKKLREALKSFRNGVAAENWSVNQVHDIANATKHYAKMGDRVVLSDLQADEIGEFGVLQFGWPINGRYVIVEVAPDNTWLLSELVEEAARYWRYRLSSPGSALLP